MSTNTINVDDVVQEWGQVYKANGNTQKDIKTKMFAKSEMENYCTRRTSKSTVLEISSVEVQDIIQRYQSGFQAFGGIKFKPVEIRLQHFKIDLPLNVYDVSETWLDFMRDDDQLDPEKFPLTRYITDELIVPKIRENIELKEIFKGVAGELVPGTPLGAGEIMNGFKKHIIDGIVAGKINRVLAGETIDATNIFDQMEKFDDLIAEELEGVPMTYLMSKRNEKNYLRDKRAEGSYTVPSEKGINKDVEFTNNDVKGLSAMSGSGIIFITPKWNIISARKAEKNEGKFLLQPNNREVNLMTDFYRGVGFLIPEYVWAFVPVAELAVESGSGSSSGV